MFRIILQNAIRTFTDNPVDLAYKFEFISIKNIYFLFKLQCFNSVLSFFN